ncbi:hypothetical protein GJ744_008906 [Endocarpon pusillum]|uniref:Uncharacterized protein n=1 Tax=Endocarpon pusillum TaxID=364733 RepID=A0A8H7E8W8_9EURO|nr:hypothetical protein GJ744_008906 [Endocarpon pusillum]
MKECVDNLSKFAMERPKKLTNPTVNRGKTALPSSQNDLESIGLRADYDNDITAPDGTKYHKYRIQANAGDDVPASMKGWIKKQKKGTHAVLGDIYVKDNGTKQDVGDAYNQFKQAFSNDIKTPTPMGSREGSPSRPGTPSQHRE